MGRRCCTPSAAARNARSAKRRTSNRRPRVWLRAASPWRCSTARRWRSPAGSRCRPRRAIVYPTYHGVGTPLGLAEDPCQVDADDTEAEEGDTPEKPNRNDERRPTGQEHSEEKAPNDEPNGCNRGDRRYAAAEVKDPHQGFVAEGGHRVDDERDLAAQAVGRPPLVVLGHHQGTLRKAREGPQAEEKHLPVAMLD